MKTPRASLTLVAPTRARDAVVEPREALVTVDELFRLHARYVAGVATRLLGRDDEVDDVVQDVFLEAHRGLSRVRETLAVRSWLATIAVRAASRRLRFRRMKSFLGFDQSFDYETVASTEASPEDRALLASIYRVLDRLPVEQRVAWTLRYVEREQLDRVAVLSECSMATAKRRIGAAELAIEEALSS